MENEKELNKQYEEYVNNFCTKNHNGYLTKANDVIYGSVQGILASRLMGEEINKVLIDGDVRLDAKNFSAKAPNFKLHDDKSPWSGNMFYTEKTFNDFGYIRLSEVGKQQFTGNLTYDGICAYLALAPEEKIIENRAEIVSEIEKNFTKEAKDVNTKSADGAEKITEIGEKFIELECVAGKIFDMSQQKIDEEEFEKMKLSEKEDQNVADAQNAYAEAMEKFNLFIPSEE